MSMTLRSWLMRLSVLALLLVALGLRLYDLNWDDNHHIHPDERFITMTALDTYVPDQLSDAFDPHRSALNPYWNVREQSPRHFAYGAFPLYLVRLSATAISTLADATGALHEWRTANDYDHINLIGRLLSAIFDTLSIALIFLLGRRVYNEKVGLLAAALATLTVQQIQLSHFYAFDTVTVTLIVAALYFGVRVVQDGEWSDSLWLGAMVALAVASKFSALPLVLVIVVAHALRPIFSLNGTRARPAYALGAVANPPLHVTPIIADEINRALLGMMLGLIGALLLYAVVSPFTFLDFQNFWASISSESEMVRGIADLPYTRQYRNTGLSYWLDNFVFWATGPALGISALGGLALVFVRVARRSASAAEFVLLTWMILYGAITLSFQVKFLRYLLPITPLLTVMAAYALWRVASSNWRLEIRHGRLHASFQSLVATLKSVPLALVLIATGLYAFAFMHVYTQPLTRVAASEWIYRNIPAGKAISDESWDDSLPFARLIDGHAHSFGEYKEVQMNLHEPDDAQKLSNIKTWLRQADYVILSSNRMYGWLSRLAERFPMTKRYYDLLFAEQLGFKQVVEFTSYPQVGPIAFNDDHSDESFTVYDHPKVLIYQKVRDLSDVEFNALFADTRPAQSPSVPTTATTRDKSLLLDRPVDQLPVVDDRAWNALANDSQWLGIAWWWLVVELLGVVALPLTLALFHKFSDRGYIFAKSLGLLIVAYVAWLLASLHLVIQSALAIWIITFIALAISIVALVLRRTAVMQFFREHSAIILIEEGLFTLAFGAFVGVRMLNPDLWQPWNGGEKTMEFAFLNAILKSPYFPPYDPFFAGGYINYYYYGIYLVGVLIKLTGIASEVAFNLAVPTLFALTSVNAFSLAFNLSNRRHPTSNTQHSTSNIHSRVSNHAFIRAVITGLLAALFITIIGNLDGFVQIAEGIGKAANSDFHSSIIGVDGLVNMLLGAPAVLLQGKSLPPFDYWRSSRVIPFTINEFPLWSFLFADLHPHMIGIPFTLLALALTAHIIVPRAASDQSGADLDGSGELATPLGGAPLHLRGMGLYLNNPDTSLRPLMSSVLLGFVLALVLGAIAVINTWDAPTYLGLALGALLLRQYWSKGARANWLPTLISAAVIGALSIALYLPFFSNYKALFVGLGVTDQHTDLQPFVIMWGLFLFVALSFVFGEIARRTRGNSPSRFVQVVARHALRFPRLLELDALIRPSLDAAQRGHENGVAWGVKLALIALTLITLASIGLLAFGLTTIAMLIWPFAFSAVLLTRRNIEPRVAFSSWLAFWVFAILLGVEIIYLQDFLGGEWKRMNTLFKFYVQVWVLMSLLAALALPELWVRVNARAGFFSFVWQSALVVLVAASLVFTFAGITARINDRFPSAAMRPPVGTLDGLAYMSVASYNWPDERHPIEMRYDLDAIHWLQQNVVGTPVIAEANVGYYREGGLRVSSYTGLPTLVGMHQGEQRYADDVGARDGLARDFFNTRDSARAMELIRELHIHYIYIGQLEQITYDAAGLAKFEQMRQAGALDVAYQNLKVMIYHVKGT